LKLPQPSPEIRPKTSELDRARPNGPAQVAVNETVPARLALLAVGLGVERNSEEHRKRNHQVPARCRMGPQTELDGVGEKVPRRVWMATYNIS